MVTVSNFMSGNTLKLSPVDRHAQTFKNFEMGLKGKHKEEKNTVEDHPLSYYKNLKDDTLVEKNTLRKRIQLNIEKTGDIPLVHFPRGLGGAQDFTFYEFLQTTKFPFYLGGPILAALFYAGVKKDNLKSAAAASRVAKHMALGVGLYYVGNALSKFVINKTVKLVRGIDLNHPYAKSVPSAVTETGRFKRKVEFRKVLESTEFTRFDLLYKEGKTTDKINERYIKIAPKYGVDPKANDVDSTLKPLIKRTVIMARAWQYALSAFYVVLGIGMANQKAWDKNSAEGFVSTIQNGILNKNIDMKNKIESAKTAVLDYIIVPLGQSFKQLWKGNSTASSIAGKSVILGSIIATAAAISLIISKTSAKDHQYVVNKNNNDKNNESNEVSNG